MANVTTASMFKGDIMLPNTSISYPEGQTLATFIDRYERDYMIKFFGYDLGTAVIANIGSVTPNADLDRIIDGDTYTDSQGVTQEWVGFSNSLLQSPIANYIYCKVMKNRDSSTTGVGEFFPETDNGIRTDAGPKLVTAWNQMVEWNLQLHYFLKANETVAAYADYIGFKNPNYELLKTINRFGC